MWAHYWVGQWTGPLDYCCSWHLLIPCEHKHYKCTILFTILQPMNSGPLMQTWVNATTTLLKNISLQIRISQFCLQVKSNTGEQSLHTGVAHLSMRVELARDTTQIAHKKRTDILSVMIYLHGHVWKKKNNKCYLRKQAWEIHLKNKFLVHYGVIYP